MVKLSFVGVKKHCLRGPFFIKPDLLRNTIIKKSLIESGRSIKIVQSQILVNDQFYGSVAGSSWLTLMRSFFYC